jgi:MoaA/NifB/PqqE/SkfB family radical SAM enzyme
MIFQSVLTTLDRLLKKRQISPQVINKISRLWGKTLLGALWKNSRAVGFIQSYGCKPPLFLVISPTSACNLHCQGCYADSGLEKSVLPWAVLDRLLDEAKRFWGVPLFVFSGGEPMLYRSEGKNLLDMVEKHSDCLFLMFTNGTLIDQETANRLSRLGNLTPAISVEGMQAETDQRRGKGIFSKVLSAMTNLRIAGVPFGISIMVTRQNIDSILKDEFLDFFFNEQGAFYGFIFQYMPIGRNPQVALIPRAEEVEKFWRRSWEVVEKKRYFLLDFWNHGPLVEGCIAAGRENGYFYINWDGKVMPCVFAPYTTMNLNDVYAHHGTINDIWSDPFFKRIRAWQREYGYGQNNPDQHGNWLHACPFRDHHATFMQLVRCSHAQPEQKGVDPVVSEQLLAQSLAAISQENLKIRTRIWEKEYLRIHQE